MQKTYEIELVGTRGLIMHHDNIAWADTMIAWGKDPANRPVSVAGDDRSPAFKWMGNLYVDMGKVVIPSDNLMTMLREGGARCPTGKRGGTFKRQTQSGLLVDAVAWPLQIGPDKEVVQWEQLEDLKEEQDFAKHEERAMDLGFALFVKRCRIGTAKHIRVRPRFDIWRTSGTVTVMDDTITAEVLQTILTFAGRFAGLCDWRPSSPKSPGPWGTFTATLV